MFKASPKIDFSKSVDYSVVRGKTALLTGGASGIGLGIATALAKNGARVALLDFNEKTGKDAEANLVSKGLQAKFFPTDVASWSSQLSAFKSALVWSSNKLDIVVTSAGVRGTVIKDFLVPDPPRPAGSDPIEPPTHVLDVNLTGTYYSTFLALHYFAALKDSSPSGDAGWQPQLLYIASLAGYVDNKLSADYGASKHGVRAIWKAVRHDSAAVGSDTQINLIAPTFIATPLIAGFEEHIEKRGASIGSVDDVVVGSMRCICDPDVGGRAVCCVKGEDGEPGNLNFDLEDDLETFGAGKTLIDNAKAGLFGWKI